MSNALNLGTQQGIDNSEITQLKADLQRERVEAGRLNKVSQDLDRLRQENEALKKELARTDSDFLKQRLMTGVNKPEMVDSEIQDMVTGISANATALATERMSYALTPELQHLKDKLEEVQQRQAQMAMMTVESQIESAYPGFISRTVKGGQDESKWHIFLSQRDLASGFTYGELLNKAYAIGNVSTTLYIIGLFLKETGYQSQSSNLGMAIQPPGFSGDGGNLHQEPKTYTQQELNKMVDTASRDYDKGLISLDKKSAIIAEVERAINEGRITG